MASDQPLNLPGLDPELRETARAAARRKGLSVEEWLQSAILESAAERAPASRPAERFRREPRDERADARSPATQEGMQAIRTRLDELAGQLDNLAQAHRPLSPSAADQETGGHQSDVASALRALEGRIASMGSPSRAPHGEPAGPASLSTAVPRPAFSDDLSFGLDRAVAEISERQRALDADGALPQRSDAAAPDRNTPDAPVVNALQDQLRALAGELRGMRQPGGIEHSIGALREELAEVARQITEAAPRRALQAIESQVHALAERIDQGRDHTINKTALAGIEEALAEIHAVLQRLSPAESLAACRDEVRALDRKIEALGRATSDSGLSTATLQHFERAIAELREIASRAASGEALIALAEEVQSIGEKVDRFLSKAAASTSDLSSILEQRFGELAAHLEGHAQIEGVAAPGHLMGLVEDIAGKLERVELGTENSPMLDAIARQLTRLTEHIEGSAAKFETLDVFEHSVRDLLKAMEELRSNTVEVAERTAKEVALEFARQGGLDGPEVGTLRQELDAVRQSQSQSDRRTQETLEAVHDTLERLVDRLATVETGVHGEQDRVPPSAPIRSVEPMHAPPSVPHMPSEPPRHALAMPAETFAGGAPSQERRPIDPTLPADHPLEPGSGRGRTGPSAAERIAASEAALGPAKPVTEADAKSNFIAAARRAAQAAAHMSASSEPAGEPAKPERSTFGALAKKFSGRRSLMLGLVLLVGTGAVHLVLNGVGIGDRSPTEPSRTVVSSAPAPKAGAGKSTSGVANAPASSSISATVANPGASELAQPAAPLQQAQSTAEPREMGTEPAPAAPRRETGTIPSVSPLTIASIQLPVGDLTGSIGRATGLGRRPDPAAARMPGTSGASPSADLPPSVGKNLRAAALAGNPTAEYEIAVRYAEGRGVAPSLEEAARWLERAANRGLAPAQYRLGSLYEKGQGVKKDLDQARRLYRAAGDAGNGKAMHNLAVLYAEGMEGKPDFKFAAEWFRKAAMHGVPDSQYNLGILCARGLGVEQSLSESYKWFALAAQQGDKDAGKKRDDVAARLDPPTLAAARAAVEAFVAEPQPEEANIVKPPAGGWDTVAAPAPAKPKAAPTGPRKVKAS